MFPLVFFLIAGTAAGEFLEKPNYDLNDAYYLFQDFIKEHGKIYHPEEYLHRLEVFKENLVEINERNAKYPQSVFTITRFADLTPEERRVHRGGFKKLGEEFYKVAIELHLRPEEITAPEQWDWRDHGAVTHVKNQGECGTCWIFSATGAIEGQYAIKHNKTLAFSEQQSLDCVGHYCGAGWPDEVMAWEYVWDKIARELNGGHAVASNKQVSYKQGMEPSKQRYHQKFGVILEEEDPYIAKQSTCHEDPRKVITKVTGYTMYKNLDEETLKQLVYEKGPLSVALDYADFPDHKKGILYPHYCTNYLSHGMVLVGYGIENGTKYWILKDSYGLDSGDQGFFKLVRGINACSMGTIYAAACTVA